MWTRQVNQTSGQDKWTVYMYTRQVDCIHVYQTSGQDKWTVDMYTRDYTREHNADYTLKTFI